MGGERARGAVTVQATLLVPALVLALLLVVQVALRQHAGHVVTAAAQRAAATAQGEGGGVADARREARRFLGHAGRGLVRDVEIRVTRNRERARARVSARIVSIVPGFAQRVVGVADGPTERFRPRTEP